MKKGFHSKKLGDVCDVLTRGISPKYMEDGGICVLNQKCIRNHAVSLEPSRRHDISIKNVPNERFVQLGDVLVNSTGTGTLGRVAQIRDLLPEQTTVDSHVTIVRPNKDLFHLDFFGYAMIMIEEEIKNAGEGCGGQTELARSALAEKFFVRFPEDAAEQKRIVSILDESFEAIDIAKANTEKNLQNARALFESELNACISQCNENWKAQRLDEICNIVGGGTPSKDNEEYYGGSIPWATVRDLKSDTLTSTEHTITSDAVKKSSTKIIPGKNVVIATRVGLGKICLLEQDTAINQDLRGIVPKDNSIISSHFLFWWFKSIAQMIVAEGTGATVQGVKLPFIKSLKIPIPPTENQNIIVNKLDSIKKKSEHLETIYQKKLVALEELKKSLLHQAFNGEL